MRKILVILFSVFYTLGTILLPMGDFSCTKNISEIYAQCKSEDPDTNLLDFAVEHLLNLESILDNFETGTEDEGEKPHTPFQNIQSISPTPVVVSNPLHFETKPILLSENRKCTYPISRDEFLRSDYLSRIFHPPSA